MMSINKHKFYAAGTLIGTLSKLCSSKLISPTWVLMSQYLNVNLSMRSASFEI